MFTIDLIKIKGRTQIWYPSLGRPTSFIINQKIMVTLVCSQIYIVDWGKLLQYVFLFAIPKTNWSNYLVTDLPLLVMKTHVKNNPHFFQNGAVCVDGINDYSCKCAGDFVGKFCEIAPFVAMMYPQTSPCQHHDCKNGICFQPMGSNDYVCKCAPGYSGKWGYLFPLISIRKVNFIVYNMPTSLHT